MRRLIVMGFAAALAFAGETVDEKRAAWRAAVDAERLARLELQAAQTAEEEALRDLVYAQWRQQQAASAAAEARPRALAAQEELRELAERLAAEGCQASRDGGLVCPDAGVDQEEPE